VLAWSLAGTGLQVTLVERGVLQDASAHAGERSVALSWGSKQLLDALGVWSGLAANAKPIRDIHVSQQGHLGAVRMHARDHQIDALGYVVRNADVLRLLVECLPDVPNVHIVAPAQVEAVEQTSEAATLRLSNGQRCRAKLVVVADGSDSNTRELVGQTAETEHYDQHAIVASLQVQGAPEAKAWERFTANGPMALLPLGQGCLSLVYTVPSDRQQELMALDDTAFIERVQASIGRRAGRIISASRRQCFPLQRVSVTSSWQGRTVLLGNAARTLHPVAGQGFNLALRDAMTLAELLQGLAIGQDAGASFVREQYLSRRQADQRETLGLTDALARGFRGESSLLGHLRGAGLIATDRLPLLKRGFARRSMGLAHRTPKVSAPS